jgi:hypothetical protein
MPTGSDKERILPTVRTHVSADTTLTTASRVIDCTTGAVADITLTLPPVEECEGLSFSIRLTTDGGKDVDIDDAHGTELLSIVGTDGYFFAISDGYRWNLCYSSAGT